MIQQRHRITAAVLLAGDLLATTVAFFTAWYLRFQVEVVPLTKNAPTLDRYLELLPFVLLLYPVVFYFHGLYRPRMSGSRVDEAVSVLLGVLLGTVLLSGLVSWYRPSLAPGSIEYFTFSRAFILLFFLLALLGVVASRAVLRWILHSASLHAGKSQRILVVGAGGLGREITEKLKANRDHGFEVVGFLDDDPAKNGQTILGVPVLGPTRDVERVVAEARIDQVFVALPLEAHRKMMRVLQAVGSELVEVKLVPDILQYAAIKATLEDLDGTPVINLTQVPLQGWSSLVKRFVDLAFSAAGLLVLAPFLPLVALVIWLEDRGPIFYQQERMGLDGRPFWIWKFRSMRVNAEASTGPVWAVEGDPRRTRFGGLLRQWSIDELPQLWNVFRGDMSLVGPRPERPSFVHEFKRHLPQYMLRHRVKAGITGWAQVHGWRGNTSVRKRLEYDLYYIENWSLVLDFRILWMTLRHGLRHNAH
ncbi:MAG TPA: undecaprenyl-phosphate glucose phosphotransferase [Thermoanaerobaculia bacterium]|nr:undecaprenyl-phosphate glucose phosphotransferase [Thermoanaerobaculia bacterium]